MSLRMTDRKFPYFEAGYEGFFKSKKKPVVTDIGELDDVLASFSGKFFTNLEFAEALNEKYPATWKRITDRYGEGGKGSGSNYSPYKFIHSLIAKYECLGRVSRSSDKWVKAHPTWGSGVMAQWYAE